MTQHLTETDVRAIAAYTRIALSPQELEGMTQDLNAIIDSLQPICDFKDLEGVEPTFHPIGSIQNVMRDDVEARSFTQEEALENAPHKQDGCFLIPSILGGGEN